MIVSMRPPEAEFCYYLKWFIISVINYKPLDQAGCKAGFLSFCERS